MQLLAYLFYFIRRMPYNEECEAFRVEHGEADGYMAKRHHLDFKAAAFSSSVFKMVAILAFSALFLLPI